MPTDQHAEPPDDHPARRALDEWALTEFTATLRPCRELTLGERAAKRQSDREMQREMEDRQAAADLPRVVHQDEDISPGFSTDCAQNGAVGGPDSARECA